MTLSQQLAANLPYLRRFARALSGSQQSGDAYVAAVLESMAADPDGFRLVGEPRAALYRRFLRVWNSIDVNTSDTAYAGNGEDRDAAACHLEGLTPRSRQAFLLTAVEGFSPQEAADILGTDSEQLSALIDRAGREIAEQVASDVLIIEDEPVIALDLTHLVEGLGHRVVARARTRKEAIAAFRAKRPGLMLVDIQLADGSSGLEAVNEILGSASVPVIFITAYPERLLTGERPEPVFLVSKPFSPETVKAIISQALFFDQRARPGPPMAATA